MICAPLALQAFSPLRHQHDCSDRECGHSMRKGGRRFRSLNINRAELPFGVPDLMGGCQYKLAQTFSREEDFASYFYGNPPSARPLGPNILA